MFKIIPKEIQVNSDVLAVNQIEKYLLVLLLILMLKL